MATSTPTPKTSPSTWGRADARVLAGEPTSRATSSASSSATRRSTGVTAETLAQLHILAEAASPHARHVVTGYGADLLFGSMLRHELYMKVTGVNDLQSLIERTCWSGEFAPFYAWSLGVEVHHLFWDPQPDELRLPHPGRGELRRRAREIVLREVAVARGYMEPRDAFRKKQALTDGTQFNRVLSSALGLRAGTPTTGRTRRADLLSRLFQA